MNKELKGTSLKMKKRRRARSKFFRFSFFSAFVFGILAGIIFFILVQFFYLDDIRVISSQIDNFRPSFTTRVYDNQDRLIHELYTENREYVALADIPELLQKAFIASEDQNFYQHPGIDISGIIRATLQNILNRRIVEGASTITQQLARNRFLSHERIFNRKIKEQVLALFIERKYTKDQILEAHLNQIYFWHGVYGVKTAALVYFGKNLSQLNLAEIAMLVGIQRSPGNFSPYVNLRAAQIQQRRVLRLMTERGYIDQSEMARAIETPIVLSGLKNITSGAPYFIDHILKELLAKYDGETVFNGGLKVYTTLDLDVQKVATGALQESGYQGAILCMDPKSGEILAMVGGKDYQESKFNRATQAYRQPGSTFKPFIYTTAIENGITAVDWYVDEPLQFPDGWKPKNYDKTFRGAIQIHEALEQSINIIAIKLLQQLGTDQVINYAKRMQVKSQLQKNLSLALGTSEVTLMELVNAYCAFANEGRIPEPYAITKIVDWEGNVIYSSNKTVRQAIPADTAYIMARLLQGVIERGTARRANIGRPVGGKTGSTEDFIDALFIGFTPDMVCGVFLGNDDRKPLGEAKTGGIIAAPIFAKVMKAAHENLPKEDFIRPESVVERSVCLKSGLLPSSSCKKTIVLPFKSGTVPTKVCNQCSE
jgi:penicillin-binding protein 1A